MQFSLARRLGICLALIAGLAACGGKSPNDVAAYRPQDQQPDNVRDLCAIYTQYPHWKTAMDAAARRWGTPEEIKMAIIWRESRFRAEASPGTSSAFGYPQAIDGTWQWYKDSTGRSAARRDNFADAADFVGWYMNLTQSKNGLSFYDPYRQYLAYHEGHGGYERGSWQSKDFLIRAAAEVQSMAAIYRRQLLECS